MRFFRIAVFDPVSCNVFSRQLGVIGVGDACIATYPSDMRALDATVEMVRPDRSSRSIPVADLHRLPGKTPHLKTVMEKGELITAVTLPRPVGGTRIYRSARPGYRSGRGLICSIAVAKGGRALAARSARSLGKVRVGNPHPRPT